MWPGRAPDSLVEIEMLICGASCCGCCGCAVMVDRMRRVDERARQGLMGAQELPSSSLK